MNNANINYTNLFYLFELTKFYISLQMNINFVLLRYIQLRSLVILYLHALNFTSLCHFSIFFVKKNKKPRNSLDLLSSRSTAETKTANHRRASYRKYFLVDIDIITKKTIKKKNVFISITINGWSKRKIR